MCKILMDLKEMESKRGVKRKPMPYSYFTFQFFFLSIILFYSYCKNILNEAELEFIDSVSL